MLEPKIITETNDYFVINKPPFMAVEPPSHGETLLDWLTKEGRVNKKDWQEDQRYGVVHRLDADTSGVMIWTKNADAQEKLRQLWQGRAVKKTYLALVWGKIDKEESIELPIIRDNRHNRQKVSLLPTEKDRVAITKITPIDTAIVGDRAITLIKAEPITGRTHQIRVHLQAIEHPILGDQLYGNKLSEKLSKDLNITRQMLHAIQIGFTFDDQKFKYSAVPPSDFQEVMIKLKVKI